MDIKKYIEEMYEAVIYDDGFSEIANNLVQSLDIRSAFIHLSLDSQVNDLNIISHSGFSEEDLTLAYEYTPIDIWTNALYADKSKRGYFVDSDTYVDRKDLYKSQIYNDVFKKIDIGYSAGAIFNFSENQFLQISLQSTHGQGTFLNDRIDFLHQLTPHFKQAVKIKETIACHKSKSTQLVSILDSLNDAVVLIDEKGIIKYLNEKAELLFNKQNFLTVKNKRLLTLSAYQEKLDALIYNNVAIVNSNITSYMNPLLIRRSNGSIVIKVEAMPISGYDQMFGFQYQYRFALIKLVEITCNVKLNKQILSSSYGLSEREIEITEYLCSGKSIGETAKSLFRSENTVRTHVKTILRKVGVKSQPQLISLLLQIARSN